MVNTVNGIGPLDCMVMYVIMIGHCMREVITLATFGLSMCLVQFLLTIGLRICMVNVVLTFGLHLRTVNFLNKIGPFCTVNFLDKIGLRRWMGDLWLIYLITVQHAPQPFQVMVRGEVDSEMDTGAFQSPGQRSQMLVR